MKRLFITFALFGVIFSANLWAHHAAEGIISDEIWDNIDQNLIDADSPHIDFDPDNPGNLMDMDVDDTGRAVVVTTGIVEFTTDLNSEDAAEIIDTEFQDVFDQTMSSMSGIPTGMTDFEYGLVDDDGDGYIDYAVVTIEEPIGTGNSQGIPTETPSTPPGNRAGG